MRWWRVAAISAFVVVLFVTGLHFSNRPTPRPPVPVGPPPPPVAPLHMDRITLERTPCFGACPNYKITVDRDGSVEFKTMRYVHLGDEELRRVFIAWRTHMPDDSLRALIAAVESPDYARLESDYSRQVTDFPSTILTVESRGVRRSTRVYAVPCVGQDDMPQFEPVPPVPAIFCGVAELVDVASCGRYWGQYSWPAASKPKQYRIPPRCKPMP